MKAKIVRGTGRAKCRLCAWNYWRIKCENRPAYMKKSKILKGESCLEIETTNSGPTRFGYLCMEHAEEFYSNLEDVMRG